MTAIQLLPAIRALPKAEQGRLLHLLVDMVARPDLPDDDVINAALFMHAVHGGGGGMAIAAELQQLILEHAAKV